MYQICNKMYTFKKFFTLIFIKIIEIDISVLNFKTNFKDIFTVNKSIQILKLYNEISSHIKALICLYVLRDCTNLQRMCSSPMYEISNFYLLANFADLL